MSPPRVCGRLIGALLLDSFASCDSRHISRADCRRMRYRQMLRLTLAAPRFAARQQLFLSLISDMSEWEDTLSEVAINQRMPANRNELLAKGIHKCYTTRCCAAHWLHCCLRRRSRPAAARALHPPPHPQAPRPAAMLASQLPPRM